MQHNMDKELFSFLDIWVIRTNYPPIKSSVFIRQMEKAWTVWDEN